MQEIPDFAFECRIFDTDSVTNEPSDDDVSLFFAKNKRWAYIYFNPEPDEDSDYSVSLTDHSKERYGATDIFSINEVIEFCKAIHIIHSFLDKKRDLISKGGAVRTKLDDYS